MSVANGAFTRTNSFGGAEAKVYPRFFIYPVEDPAATAAAGRLICHDEERVEIILPGNPLTRPVHVVTNEHRARWSAEYEAFKRGQEMSPTGTPLEQWPILKRSQIMELKSLNFVTVEQIAAMDDLAVQRIGLGGRGLRELAIGYLDDAAAQATSTRLSAENERKDAEIASLKRQVEELGALVSSLHGQVQDIKNAPHPIATFIPGMHDPVEQAKVAQPVAPVAQSSLNAMPAPRRRGRPPKVAEVAA